MDFISFCQDRGIIIQAPPPLGIWKRFPTTDHPKKRNGAVKFMGDYAFVQNHALETEVSVWKGEASAIKRADYRVVIEKAEYERQRMQHDAATKAAVILKSCMFGNHPYLKAKGFEDEHGNVMAHEGRHLLVIPMRVDQRLVGCQLIDEEGGKKFLYGQTSSGAEFVFNNKGHHILCEGYATALSVRSALKQLKRRYTIHVCFSAGNMKKIASTLKEGLVIADNDASKTGERVAKEIGWPYWMSDREGEDANDAHQRLGLFKFSMALTGSLNTLRPIYG